MSPCLPDLDHSDYLVGQFYDVQAGVGLLLRERDSCADSNVARHC